jgi:GNAT superfamily N-acetyltransferase
MISVRQARPGDGAILMRTTRALADNHGLTDTFTASAGDFEHALFRTDPVIGALIAEIGGEAVGGVVWHRSFSTNRGKEIMYLEDISVLEEHRGKGVGLALMRKTAQVALAKGYPSIYWLMMDWNTDGERFYKRIGAEIEADMKLCRIHGDALMALAR